jgi:glycosyltransferase involved in cell wall biosynthesis
VFAAAPSPELSSLRVVAFSPDKLGDTVASALRNRVLKGAALPVKRWAAVRSFRTLALAIPASAFDAVHVHNSPIAVVAIRQRHPTLPIVLHMNNDHLTEIDRRLASSAVRSSDMVAFCSRYLRQQAIDHLGEPDLADSVVVYNGARLAPATKGAEGRRGEILFLGRVVRFKGAHVLLEAFKRIHASMGSLRLLIVGPIDTQTPDGVAYFRELRAAAEPLGNAVEFVGAVPHSRVVEHMSRAAIFACPSLWNDPLAMVLAEAMAAGAPVIAFARGGIPELIGDAGVLVHETTAEALAEALLQLLRDPERLERLRSAGMERVRAMLDWKVIARDWSGVLSGLTAPQ